MSFLICDTCHGYYELKEGESPEDFSSKCDCGGNLEFKSSISSNDETKSVGRDKIAHGYSHTDKKSYNYKIVMIIGIAIILVGIIGIITFNIIGLIIAIAGFIIFYKGYSEGYSWIKGDKGEKIVSLYLENLPSGYFVFNDVNIPNGKGNIDHLVIGPAGIFLIETKNYSGFFKIDGDNWSIGYSNRKLKKNPGKQVKLNALDLSKFLNKKLGKKFWVYGVVTLLNNNFKLINKPNRYYVVGAENLTKFILKFQNKIDTKTTNNVVNLMQNYCTEIYYKREDVELE